jgi:peroxiredoxin Q/BCP
MELKKGDSIPNFKARLLMAMIWQSDADRSETSYLFYPKTIHWCTAQACSFRDQYEDFKDLGADRISSDTVESHQKFTKQYKLPSFLLSDHDKKIRRLWCSIRNVRMLPGRVTYVVDKEGKIIMILTVCWLLSTFQKCWKW